MGAEIHVNWPNTSIFIASKSGIIPQKLTALKWSLETLQLIRDLLLINVRATVDGHINREDVGRRIRKDDRDSVVLVGRIVLFHEIALKSRSLAN